MKALTPIGNLLYERESSSCRWLGLEISDQRLEAALSALALEILEVDAEALTKDAQFAFTQFRKSPDPNPGGCAEKWE